MKLSELTRKLETSSVFTDCEISFVTDNFDEVKKGCIFVCITGKNFDSLSVAKEALEKGASYVVTPKDINIERQIIAEDTRKAYSLLCSAFYGDPAKRLKMIGITGTNGKTSTAFFLREILENAGHKTGMLGTVTNIVGDRVTEPHKTTPDPSELFKFLKEMADAGCEYCVTEASSQALHQQRLAGIMFDIAIFTNLTEDHLDYHGNSENYALAKKSLFENCRKAIINFDDEKGKYMTENVSGIEKVVTYSVKSDRADYTAKNISLSPEGVSYELVGTGVIGRINLSVPGVFSVSNSMAAAAAALECGIDIRSISESFAKNRGIKGRMERVPVDRDYTVIIDYAHTPDGLENLLRSVRKVYENRVITVFGCGGDRDKLKRPLMGKVAGELSDVAIVTSDNPRSEDPERIIKDISAGMENSKARVITEIDRTKAIETALKTARRGDVVVLAGKGHETYQVLKGGKIHFDEREAVKNILEKEQV